MDKRVHTQKILKNIKRYNLSTKKEPQKYISNILQKNEIDFLKLHDYESKVNTLKAFFFLQQKEENIKQSILDLYVFERPNGAFFIIAQL